MVGGHRDHPGGEFLHLFPVPVLPDPQGNPRTLRLAASGRHPLLAHPRQLRGGTALPDAGRRGPLRHLELLHEHRRPGDRPACLSDRQEVPGHLSYRQGRTGGMARRRLELGGLGRQPGHAPAAEPVVRAGLAVRLRHGRCDRTSGRRLRVLGADAGLVRGHQPCCLDRNLLPASGVSGGNRRPGERPGGPGRSGRPGPVRCALRGLQDPGACQPLHGEVRDGSALCHRPRRLCAGAGTQEIRFHGQSSRSRHPLRELERGGGRRLELRQCEPCLERRPAGRHPGPDAGHHAPGARLEAFFRTAGCRRL